MGVEFGMEKTAICLGGRGQNGAPEPSQFCTVVSKVG